MLVAPARFASPATIQDAASAVLAAGFTPVIPPDLDSRDHQFAGSDSHRAYHLNSAFRDQSIRAVFALRGGYGSGRLLPILDSSAYIADPTWIIGFSDITALHSWSTNLGISSLHAPVASTLSSTIPADVEAIWSTLRGEFDFNPNVKFTGGNLSVLYSLLGTPYFPNVSDSYLFIEDIDEYLYHIDRMILAFKLAGVFAFSQIYETIQSPMDKPLTIPSVLICEKLSQLTSLQTTPLSMTTPWVMETGTTL